MPVEVIGQIYKNDAFIQSIWDDSQKNISA